MAGHRIHLPGYRLDKHGRLVRDVRRLDVSTRLKQASEAHARGPSAAGLKRSRPPRSVTDRR